MPTGPSDPSSSKPIQGTMNSVLSTLREALRPGDAPRHPKQTKDTTTTISSSSSSPSPSTSSAPTAPRRASASAAADTERKDAFNSAVQQPHQRRDSRLAEQAIEDDDGDDHHNHDRESRPRAFPEAYRDATGHKSVMESIMPGNQGLSGKPAWDPSVSSSPPKQERRGSGVIRGALEAMTRRRSSSASESSQGRSNEKRDGRGGGGEGGANYTYDPLTGTRTRRESTGGGFGRESARPRTAVTDSNSNNNDLKSSSKETARGSMDKLPASVARESQVSR
ncbi:uncharacterized protein B0I36DRAFT_309479, partial [Microdochium trichocladiopsis]